MEGDAEFQQRGPIEGERFVVLDDLIEGRWYTFQCIDDEDIYAPFAGFKYNALAKARGGFWIKWRAAGGRIKLIWSGHVRRIINRS